LHQSARGAGPAGAGAETGGIGKRQDADDLAGIRPMNEKALHIFRQHLLDGIGQLCVRIAGYDRANTLLCSRSLAA